MVFSMLEANVKMGVFVYGALLFLLIMECSALTCRSEHGPRKEELRKVFNNCVRQQQGKPNENRRQTADNEWRNRGENQRNPWENNNSNDNWEDRNSNRKNNNRNDNWDDRNSNRNNNKDKDRNGDYRGGNNNGRNVGQNNMNDNRGSDGRYEMSSGNGRDDRMNMNGNRGSNGGRNDMMNSYGTTQHLRGQDEFLESEEYGDSSQNNYYYSALRPRRYKREKRIEINSGQRSQYNPHSQKNNGNNDKNRENDKGDGKNSNENNSSREIDKTDDRGMPDRYLVTHVLTKDETNEDLRDFLQESIEECFQILDNENTEDKCEFSKNLLTCLSEKGRANCDDWNGKPSFLF